MERKLNKLCSVDYLNRWEISAHTYLLNKPFEDTTYLHCRLFRETKPSLNDFDEEGKKYILDNIYNRYIKICDLKPVLDAKKVINILL